MGVKCIINEVVKGKETCDVDRNCETPGSAVVAIDMMVVAHVVAKSLFVDDAQHHRRQHQSTPPRPVHRPGIALVLVLHMQLRCE